MSLCDADARLMGQNERGGRLAEKSFRGVKFVAATPPVQIMPISANICLARIRVFVGTLAFPWKVIGTLQMPWCSVIMEETSTQNAVHRIMNRFNIVTTTTYMTPTQLYPLQAQTYTNTKMSVMTCNLLHGVVFFSIELFVPPKKFAHFLTTWSDERLVLYLKYRWIWKNTRWLDV